MRRATRERRVVTVWRWLGTVAALFNLLIMMVAASAGNLSSFLLAYVGATLGFYAVLYCIDEEEEMAAAGYLDLARRIAWDIRENDRKPGARLPAMEHIAEEYDTSRSTVMRAIRVLVEEGVVRAVPGRGVYVAAPGGDLGERSDTKCDRIEGYLKRVAVEAPSGAQLPHTDAVAAMFSVHPSTVRRVQAQLIQCGLITRSKTGDYFKA